VIPLLLADIVAWIARDALGLTFLLSAWGKLRDVDALVIGVLRYEIGPPVLMRRLAPLLPLGELLLAAFLLTGTAVRAAGKAAMRVVPRDLIDLEDMLDRIGVAQGNRPWVPVGDRQIVGQTQSGLGSKSAPRHATRQYRCPTM
jgi:hypothetical protein